MAAYKSGRGCADARDATDAGKSQRKKQMEFTTRMNIEKEKKIDPSLFLLFLHYDRIEHESYGDDC